MPKGHIPYWTGLEASPPTALGAPQLEPGQDEGPGSSALSGAARPCGVRGRSAGVHSARVDVRQLYERERPRWGRLALALWLVVAYLLVLYVALRWGGHSAENILPSAD